MQGLNPIRTLRCSIFLQIVFVGFALAAAANCQSPQTDLSYNWKVGLANTYALDYEETFGGAQMKATGTITFQLTQSNVTVGFDGERLAPEEPEDFTSTAFLINREGYLLTCGHCVENAQSVTVTVAGNEYRASVVATNPYRDLAILKIDDAKNLPRDQMLRLGTERQVSLAQDLRVVGVPLSDVLGSSVKNVRGAIAGFIGDNKNDYRTARSYQIDAVVNPGNSGGPIVDDSGAVIGIINAKLTSENGGGVGFGIPVRYAIELLKKHQVKFFSSESNEQFSGPELAKQVTPAVAFVQTTTDPKLSDKFKLAVTGMLKRGGRVENISGRMIVDRTGAVIDERGCPRLRAMLSSIGPLPLVELPKTYLSKWTSHEYFIRTSPTEGSRDYQLGGTRHYRSPSWYGNRRGASETQIYEVEHRFKIKKTKTPNETQVALQSTMEPLDEYAGQQLTQKVSSTWTFDTRRGLPTARSASGTTTLVRSNGTNEKSPFKLSMRLTQSKQKKVARQHGDYLSNRERVNVFKDLPSESADQLTPEQVAAFTDPEAKMDSTTQLKFLNRLSRWKSEENSEAVAATLVRLSKNNEKSVRTSAIEALLHWSPDTATACIVDELDRANVFSKRTWILKLAKTQTRSAAEKLCSLLGNSRTKKTAQKAIESMGDVAAPVLLEQIIAAIKSASKNGSIDEKSDARIVLMLKLLKPNISGDALEQLIPVKDSPTLSANARAAISDLVK